MYVLYITELDKPDGFVCFSGFCLLTLENFWGCISAATTAGGCRLDCPYIVVFFVVFSVYIVVIFLDNLAGCRSRPQFKDPIQKGAFAVFWLMVVGISLNSRKLVLCIIKCIYKIGHLQVTSKLPSLLCYH